MPTMPAPLHDSAVRLATMKAANDWIAAHDGNQSRAAREAREKLHIELKQPQLSEWARGEKIGPKAAHVMALLYETTPDGLVARMGGVESITLRDVPGWAKAKAEAMERRGGKVDDWVWAAIDHVSVPSRLRPADVAMVLDIADFLDRYGQVSAVRQSIKREEIGG